MTADTLTPRDVTAMFLVAIGAAEPVRLADQLLAALTREGFTVLPTAEHEDLLELRASYEGRFPRCYVIKPDRDQDFYVGWSDVTESPVWLGNRAQALRDGCPASRLRRADETGTSAKTTPAFYSWDSKGMIAEQRGWLPRANLAAYAIALSEGRKNDAWDLLEPFDDETEVRRG